MQKTLIVKIVPAAAPIGASAQSMDHSEHVKPPAGGNGLLRGE